VLYNSALSCSLPYCRTTQTIYASVMIPDNQAYFKRVVEYITNASPIDDHSYLVRSTSDYFVKPGYRLAYYLKAEFTVCNITADQILVKLNSSIANSDYANVLSYFFGGGYEVSGTFRLGKLAPTDAPTFRPTQGPTFKPEGPTFKSERQRTKPIRLSLGNTDYDMVHQCFTVLCSSI
jgi:hypothetical protein